MPDQPWTVVVGHDGVFKVLLLTLFDLPLERFWMWSSDLCGISVIEFRAGRPVVRAMNLTEHLAPLLDEAAQAETEARARSGRSDPHSRRPRRGTPPGRRCRTAWLAALGAPIAHPAPLAASEREPEEPDPEPAVRVAEGLQPIVAELPPAVCDLDLGRGDRLELGPDAGQDVAERGRVLERRLGRARSEAEPPGEARDGGVDALRGGRAARAAAPGEERDEQDRRDQDRARSR